MPRKGDWTANNLYGHFGRAERTQEANKVEPGDLLFWFTDRSVARHVEMCWHRADYGIPYTIGASGGGSDTVNVAVAIARNAYVKIRPAYPGWTSLDPFEEVE